MAHDEDLRLKMVKVEAGSNSVLHSTSILRLFSVVVWSVVLFSLVPYNQ